jgi:periplasmic divalent cation tolerance protein
MVAGSGHEAWRLAQVQQNDKPVLIYSTFPSTESARTVGRELVERRLAACINVIPGMTSIYRWEGRIAEEAETVVIIKTVETRAEAAMALVKERHAYTNPALIVLPVLGGAPAYLAWLAGEARPQE